MPEDMFSIKSFGILLSRAYLLKIKVARCASILLQELRANVGPTKREAIPGKGQVVVGK